MCTSIHLAPSSPPLFSSSSSSCAMFQEIGSSKRPTEQIINMRKNHHSSISSALVFRYQRVKGKLAHFFSDLTVFLQNWLNLGVGLEFCCSFSSLHAWLDPFLSILLFHIFNFLSFQLTRAEYLPRNNNNSSLLVVFLFTFFCF